MSFREFEQALELLAADKGVAADEVRQKVAQSSGPLCNATQAAHVRLHDDKSTYTGMANLGFQSLRLDKSTYTGMANLGFQSLRLDKSTYTGMANLGFESLRLDKSTYTGMANLEFQSLRLDKSTYTGGTQMRLELSACDRSTPHIKLRSDFIACNMRTPRAWAGFDCPAYDSSNETHIACMKIQAPRAQIAAGGQGCLSPFSGLVCH